ncbi:hypothetical protein DFH11DRAFT_831774 [Phellopilus nigrolimitatus]|nr:hypothetical protein DFH11DRAFT_831774 [Phellopilus nigrolimitatus]
MASQTTAGDSLDIGGTFGIAYIGAMIAMALYGVTSLQSYLYYMYYPKDDFSFKLLVATIWTLESLQVAFVCHAMYSYLISNYANPLALEIGVWSLFASMLCNTVISAIVQIFFTVRVHILSSKKWWITVILAITITAHLAFGFETVIDSLILKELSKFSSITYTAALPFAITAIFPDVIIAGLLCYYLQGGKGGFRGTNALINQLIIYSINRCILTTLVVIVEVILFKALPGTFYYLAVDFCVGKLYANSLLATLNTRQSLRGKGLESDTMSGSLPTRSSHSVPTPQLRNNRHEVAFELTDLRATWPSSAGSRHSFDSVIRIGPDPSTHRKNEIDVTVLPEVEAQQFPLNERKAQGRSISFDP